MRNFHEDITNIVHFPIHLQKLETPPKKLGLKKQHPLKRQLLPHKINIQQITPFTQNRK